MRIFLLISFFLTALHGATVELVRAKVTAYCPCEICCSPSADGTTSTGLRTDEHPYGIAADPRALPYGTMLRIPGYLEQSFPDAWWEVDDTGGAMRQAWANDRILHIDLRFKTHTSATRWGVQWVLIEVIRPG